MSSFKIKLATTNTSPFAPHPKTDNVKVRLAPTNQHWPGEGGAKGGVIAVRNQIDLLEMFYKFYLKACEKIRGVWNLQESISTKSRISSFFQLYRFCPSKSKSGQRALNERLRG